MGTGGLGVREHPRVRHPTGDFWGGTQAFGSSSPRRYLLGVSALRHRRRDKRIFILAQSPRGDPLCFAVLYRSTTRGERAVGKSLEKRAAVTRRDFFFSKLRFSSTRRQINPSPRRLAPRRLPRRRSKLPGKGTETPNAPSYQGGKVGGGCTPSPSPHLPPPTPRLQAPCRVNPAKKRISAQNRPVFRPVHPRGALHPEVPAPSLSPK